MGGKEGQLVILKKVNSVLPAGRVAAFNRRETLSPIIGRSSSAFAARRAARRRE